MEAVLAIGVVAFSFLSIFALLPVGLEGFCLAEETSVSAEIVQRIVSDAEQTDFNILTANAAGGNHYTLPIRYFDDQGSEVNVADALAPSSAELTKIIYWVRIGGSLPGNADSTKHTSSYFTSLPSTGGERFNPRASTFLTIQIVSNPRGVNLMGMVNAEGLVDDAKASEANLRLQTYSIVISRNGY